jgi:hypothetical protein
MVGRVGIYRGVMAVGKRVGSKENVDRWIGGLGALREERVRGEEESQNGRRSVGEREIACGLTVHLLPICSS